MKNDLNKAGPPPIPKDALKPPTPAQRAPVKPMPSPWDSEVVSSAPPPIPQDAKSKAPLWMNRHPILHPDHSQELEMNAAVNEFGKRMPRGQAEDAAYSDYQKKQRTQAAAHHLAGMRAAHAAGDIESARKHGMMYDLHVKALGHEPVGPAHPDIANAMGEAKAYRFKSHKGDLFALDSKPSVISSAPPLGKSERQELYQIWLQANSLLQKAEAKKQKKIRPCFCVAYEFPHRHRGGRCQGK